MKEETWNKLLEKINKNFINQLCATVVDNIFNEGLIKLDSFFRICLGRENEPLERHQFEITIECCPQILEWTFGINYYNKHKLRIKKLCNFSHLKSCVVTVIKRQHGKTEMIVRIASASLLVFPLVETSKENCTRISEFCIRSYKGEHAKEILERCWKYIKNFEYLLDDFLTHKKRLKTSTKIELINKYDTGDVRWLRVLQGGITGLSKKRFFGDEFFKWTSDASHTQLGPQLQVEGTSGFFFSTMERSSHWCSGWINSEQKLAKILNYGEICNDCMKLPYEQQVKCTHCRQLQAHWIDPKKKEAVMSILPPSDVLTEMYNVVSMATGQLWKEDYLEKSFREKNFEKFSDYFMFVDPSMTSTDGSWSGTTIVAEKNKEIIICYLNTDKTDSPNTIQNYIIDDLEYFVKNFAGIKNKFYITLFVEHNTINHGKDIFFKLKDNYLLKDRVIFAKKIKYDKKEDKYERFGVTKKGGDEEIFADLLHTKLYNEKICFHKDWCTRNSIGRKIKDVLIKQCTHVRNIVKKGEKSKPYIVSTKDFNDKKTKNDLYMSLVSALYNIQELKYNPNNTALYRQFFNRKTIDKQFCF